VVKPQLLEAIRSGERTDTQPDTPRSTQATKPKDEDNRNKQTKKKPLASMFEGRSIPEVYFSISLRARYQNIRIL